jgi:glycosyltransferase involved in cell wall biosynthesis
MPVYNGGDYLKEAIDSILNQTYTHFEFIIINDGSTDNSEEIILSYKDSRIIYVKNPENYKLIKTLNIGFSIAKGCYIARMDADDISHLNRLQKQVQFLEENEEYGLVGSGVNLLNGQNKSQLLYHTDHESLKFALAFYCPFIHPSVMIRKTIIENMEMVFDERFVHAEDYELWTRLAFKTKMANLPEYLLDYRVHDSQISSQHNIHQIELAISIRKKYLFNYFSEVSDGLAYIFKLKNNELSIRRLSEEIKKLYVLDHHKSVFGGENFSRYLIDLWKNLFLESNELRVRDFVYFVFNSITWKSNWTIRQMFAICLKTFK